MPWKKSDISGFKLIDIIKKDKDNLTKHFVHKELHMSDFLITIEEYVGARETPSSTPKR